jgi:hypothetical protein
MKWVQMRVLPIEKRVSDVCMSGAVDAGGVRGHAGT